MKTRIALAACAVLLFFSGNTNALTGAYSPDEILGIARELGEECRFPREKLVSSLYSLKVNMKEPWFAKLASRKPVRAVFVYNAGEGGFVVKFMKGSGLIRFMDRPKPVDLYINSWSAGAMIGGSAVWGIGLVMGLKDVRHFGGDYSGAMQNATAADSGVRNALVLSLSSESDSAKSHDVCMVFASRGLSAGVGGGHVSIVADID